MKGKKKEKKDSIFVDVFRHTADTDCRAERNNENPHRTQFLVIACTNQHIVFVRIFISTWNMLSSFWIAFSNTYHSLFAFKFKLKFFSFYFNHFSLIATKENAEVLPITKVTTTTTEIGNTLKANSKLRTGSAALPHYACACLFWFHFDLVVSFNSRQMNLNIKV